MSHSLDSSHRLLMRIGGEELPKLIQRQAAPPCSSISLYLYSTHHTSYHFHTVFTSIPYIHTVLSN